jgi:hypothetical protein
MKDLGHLPAALFRLASAVLLVGLAGCASIDRFDVSPTAVCSGETVNVSWKTCGATTLTQVPIQPGQSDECLDSLPVGSNPMTVPNSGTVRREMAAANVFYVETSGWFGKPIHQCKRVFVNQALPLSGIPQCAGPRAIRTVVSRPPGAEWSGQMGVGGVQNLNQVRVSVRHDGRVASLAPNEISAEFKTSNPAGEWIIESELPAGPDCGQAGASVPPSLTLQVRPLCQN